jgi:hypothetical protein
MVIVILCISEPNPEQLNTICTLKTHSFNPSPAIQPSSYWEGYLNFSVWFMKNMSII